jgi:xylulokinase
VLGVRYVRLARDDFAMLGDILLAGHAVGLYPDLKAEAVKFTERERVYQPEPARTAHYGSYVRLYRKLFDAERDLFASLQSLPPYAGATRT